MLSQDASIDVPNVLVLLVTDGDPEGGGSWCQDTPIFYFNKVIQDPRKNPDRHQNLIDSSFGHAPALQKFHRNALAQLKSDGVPKKLNRENLKFG